MKRFLFLLPFIFCFLMFFVPITSFAQNETLHYSIKNGTCVQDPNGRYNNLLDCFKDTNSSPGIPRCIYTNYAVVCAPSDTKNIPPGTDSPIDESMPTATVEFRNLPEPDNTYYYCLKSIAKECSSDDWNEVKLSDNGFAIKICGDGATKLKTSCKEDGHDWFHAGYVYSVFLASGKKPTPGTGVKLSASDVKYYTSFYVKHYYPGLGSPNPQGEELSPPASSFTLQLVGRNHKGGDEADLYNDYYYQIKSLDSQYVAFKDNGKNCIAVDGKSNSGEKTITLPKLSPDGVPVSAGTYVLRIEDGTGNEGNGASTTCHEGNFTYYDITFEVNDNGEITHINPAIADPFQKESSATTQPLTPAPPCPTEVRDHNGYCTVVSTALGPINTEPRAFIGDVFRIVLSIAGIVAVAFFIQAGYTLMTSAGNKEKVGQAREQITAAIIGLIFIILSIAIFEFIGIDILHIPGLTR